MDIGQGEEASRVCSIDQIPKVDEVPFDLHSRGARPGDIWLVVGDSNIMAVDDTLDGSALGCGIKVATKISDLDHLGGDGFPQGRWLIDWVREQRFVELFGKFAEAFGMLRPVLVDAHFVGSPVGEDQVPQEFLLKLHGSIKALAIRSNFGLQNDQVEIQRL